MIFGRNRSSRHALSFEKFSNGRKITEPTEPIDPIGRSTDRSNRPKAAVHTNLSYPPVQKESDKFGEISARFSRGFGEVTATLLFLKFKLNVNSNENESKNASGGACARGAKRPRVGVLPRCVFAFVFV